MVNAVRSKANPLLIPDPNHAWEADSVFNASIIKDHAKKTYHLVYRAVSGEQDFAGKRMKVSSIGYARSTDGVHFVERRQFISPELPWEAYGCEDPRVTKMGDSFYIFYTALSNHPPSAPGIKVAVAKTRDFHAIDEKHLVTFFNAKAMTMFPQKVNGKIAVMLTAHTDMPPAFMSLALLDKEEELWSESYWDSWYKGLKDHVIPIYKTSRDQVEVGATPLLTDRGWLVIYCYIQNYFGTPKLFRIDAVLLKRDDPMKVLGQTNEPILVPEHEYEIYGQVPNVIFPSGAILEEGEVKIYYGGADTTVCMAHMKLKELMGHIQTSVGSVTFMSAPKLLRYEKNPILAPVHDNPWKSKFTMNPASVYLGGKVHILYRAMGDLPVSVIGYAASYDGFNLDEIDGHPIYTPRDVFEKRFSGGESGCEDPRISVIGDTLYMFYTAFDGTHPPRVAITSITTADFLKKRWWKWAHPNVISPPGIDDKDACVFPEKIKGKYAIFHRLIPNIWLDFVDTLDFGKDIWLGGRPIMIPRPSSWDSDRIGIGPPPIKTEKGWLLIYHALSKYDRMYRLGAVLLDLKNPTKIVARFNDPILEPEAPYETNGIRPNTVFANGAVVIHGQLLVYYGGGDTVSAVASIGLDTILTAILKGH